MQLLMELGEENYSGQWQLAKQMNNDPEFKGFNPDANGID